MVSTIRRYCLGCKGYFTSKIGHVRCPMCESIRTKVASSSQGIVQNLRETAALVNGWSERKKFEAECTVSPFKHGEDEPNSDKASSKEKVRAVYPTAMDWPAWWDKNKVMIVVSPINDEFDPRHWNHLSDSFVTADEAWDDAASKLPPLFGPLNARDQSAVDAGCSCDRKMPYLDWTHHPNCRLYRPLTVKVGKHTALLDFLRANHYVLVTPAANGMFCCQCCGQMANAASEIKHEENCVTKEGSK